MRIIGGESRGRRLKAPRGRSVRPTSDRTREALFNILSQRIAGSWFLDLFAGAGAVGLEALSRGAERVVMVESSERAARAIEDNASAVGVTERLTLIRGKAAPAARGLAAAGAKFDIVFMDPPYRDRKALEQTLAEVAQPDGILAPDAVVVVEHSAHAAPPAAVGILIAERSRRFGEGALTFFRPRPAEEPTDGQSGVSGQL